MADGQLIAGMQTAGSAESASGDVTICSWEIPQNTTVRVEIVCELQRTTSSSKSTYILAGMFYRIAGNATLIDSTIKYNEEGSTAGYEVVLTTDGTSVIAKTASPDGNTYRVVGYMKIYSVEQTITIP